MPLVELYTSEGCSSCPPADRWFSSQSNRTDANWLSFHVDYWDYIGWPDRFALAGNSARQRERVNAAGDDSVYTPQVMVGEQVRTAWNSRSKFEAVLREARGEARLGLDLELKQQEGAWEILVGSTYRKEVPADARVWLARTADGQTTQVGRGENKGATLHHDRVVRRQWGPWAAPVRKRIHVEVPKPGESAWSFVAFAEDANGRILQSLALHEDDCEAQGQ